MNIKLSAVSQPKSLSLICTLVLISFLTIGGCSENNGGGGVDAPAPQAMCTTAPMPCTSITSFENIEFICESLLGSSCAVDLEQVIAQTDPDKQLGINNDTVMWIEAWGANGGTSSPGTSGGAGGYAVTTTTVNDIKAENNGSSLIYYFYGRTGGGGRNCGAGGGGSTIVTTEDLVLNPDTNPTQSAPPVLLVAGGGGGGAGQNNEGLCAGNADRLVLGADGGNAIATIILNGNGPGGSTQETGQFDGFISMGGNLNGDGKGGAGGCLVCNGNSNQKPGNDGYGGLGGRGGSGADCGGPQPRTFSNIPSGIFINFTSGLGGDGSSAQNAASCNAGGGGGGGGYGGGGGGSQQNDSKNAVAGDGQKRY